MKNDTCRDFFLTAPFVEPVEVVFDELVGSGGSSQNENFFTCAELVFKDGFEPIFSCVKVGFFFFFGFSEEVDHLRHDIFDALLFFLQEFYEAMGVDALEELYVVVFNVSDESFLNEHLNSVIDNAAVESIFTRNEPCMTGSEF